MLEFWSNLGGKLGVGLCAAGLLAVFLGWNGAASVDRVEAQFPYLISGGVTGLCLVVMGVGVLIVQNQRAERVELQRSLRELKDVLEAAGQPVEVFEAPVRRPTPERYARALRPRASHDSDDEATAPRRRQLRAPES